jgi:hypothetical protein
MVTKSAAETYIKVHANEEGSNRVTRTRSKRRPLSLLCPLHYIGCILQRTALPRPSIYLEMVQSSGRTALAVVLAPVCDMSLSAQ